MWSFHLVLEHSRPGGEGVGLPRAYCFLFVRDGQEVIVSSRLKNIANRRRYLLNFVATHLSFSYNPDSCISCETAICSLS